MEAYAFTNFENRVEQNWNHVKVMKHRLKIAQKDFAPLERKEKVPVSCCSSLINVIRAFMALASKISSLKKHALEFNSLKIR